MSAMTKHNLREIEHRYDPNNDYIPDGPPVTWAEWYLRQAVVELFERIEKLESENLELRERTDSLQQSIDYLSGIED